MRKLLRRLQKLFRLTILKHPWVYRLKHREGKRVVTVIECDGKLATFTATIDDLLFSASTAENALKAVKKL